MPAEVFLLLYISKIFFNGSTRGKYYKILGSAAYYAAYFKQADEAAGTGTRHGTFCARA